MQNVQSFMYSSHITWWNSFAAVKTNKTVGKGIWKGSKIFCSWWITLIHIHWVRFTIFIDIGCGDCAVRTANHRKMSLHFVSNKRMIKFNSNFPIHTVQLNLQFVLWFAVVGYQKKRMCTNIPEHLSSEWAAFSLFLITSVCHVSILVWCMISWSI